MHNAPLGAPSSSKGSPQFALFCEEYQQRLDALEQPARHEGHAQPRAFLQQAQFSSTKAEITELRGMSYAQWLANQFVRYQGITGWNWLEARGYGAIELLARYSRIDLDSDGIAGGREHNWTLGANWYLTPYFKFQANYVKSDATRGAFSADPSVFQLRAQMHVQACFPHCLRTRSRSARACRRHAGKRAYLSAERSSRTVTLRRYSGRDTAPRARTATASARCTGPIH